MSFNFNRTIKLLWQFTLIVCLSLGWKQNHAAESLDIHEYQVKATFLLNFSKYVTYPDEVFSSPSADLNICVLGDDPFQGSLDTLVKDEKIQGHLIKVRYLRDVGKASECHTLFVSQSEQKQLTNVINHVKQRPILTVSDMEEFVARGGMIQFYIMDNTVRFSIDPTTANEAKLKVSARLLQIAKVVR